MKRNILIAVICVAVLLLGVYLYLRPTYVDISLPALDMTPGVADPAETTITIRGWYHRPLFDRPYIQLEALKFLSQEITPYESVYGLTQYQNAPVVFTNVAWKDMELLRTKACHILWKLDQSCCAIVLGDERVLIGAADGDFEKALALFGSEFYLGE